MFKTTSPPFKGAGKAERTLGAEDRHGRQYPQKILMSHDTEDMDFRFGGSIPSTSSKTYLLDQKFLNIQDDRTLNAIDTQALHVAVPREKQEASLEKRKAQSGTESRRHS